jgi:hypothetical protein
MDVARLLQDLSNAVEAAKEKGDVVNGLRADLASYTATKQAEIDAAVEEYTDAKVSAERLQEQAREAIGAILPAPETRYRVTP